MLKKELTIGCRRMIVQADIASKRVNDGLLRVLAREVSPHQVTRNHIAPGWNVLECDQRAGSQSQPQYQQNMPPRRRGTDQDLDKAVVLLARDLASFITGVSLPVCGGHFMPTIVIKKGFSSSLAK